MILFIESKYNKKLDFLYNLNLYVKHYWTTVSFLFPFVSLVDILLLIFIYMKKKEDLRATI